MRSELMTNGKVAGRTIRVKIRRRLRPNAFAVSISRGSTVPTPAAVLITIRKTENTNTTTIRNSRCVPNSTMNSGSSASLETMNSVFT